MTIAAGVEVSAMTAAAKLAAVPPLPFSFPLTLPSPPPHSKDVIMHYIDYLVGD